MFNASGRIERVWGVVGHGDPAEVTGSFAPTSSLDEKLVGEDGIEQ